MTMSIKRGKIDKKKEASISLKINVMDELRNDQESLVKTKTKFNQMPATLRN